ncbi:MAG: hypothetical protein ACLQUY_24415 [Ktedonobacterales bacterium]
MSIRRRRLLTSITGVVGVVTLITAFIVNPGVPAGDTIPQAIAWNNQHHDAILIGSWLQTTGTFLSIVFVIALLYLAGALSRVTGWVTFFGGTILMMVSLTEVTFYLLTLQGSSSNDGVTVSLGLQLIAAIQHGYSLIAAPAVFFPLGAVILQSRVLPSILAYLAFLLGAIFAVLGVATLFHPSLQSIVDVFAGIQGFWFLAAAMVIGIASEKKASVPA